MNAEVLVQNIFNLFVVAIILEASVMALFSMSAFKMLNRNTAVDSARDVIILLIALVLCYKVEMLTVFTKTGIDMPKMIDTIISALVLTRMTNLVLTFFSRIKVES
jgi:hypothetical protein